MASRNPPTKRKNYAKVKGKYALPEQAAIINVAGEVFVLNTTVLNYITNEEGKNYKDDESYNYSEYYDQSLKGEKAFNEFFLSVFDTMTELTVKNKVVFKIDSEDKRTEIKERAKLIYILLFPFKTLAGDAKTKGKKPCSARDFQILMQTLYYRRKKLKEQIADYNEVSTSDMKARYLRDHLMFLNKLIEDEIPQTVECDNVDGILAGQKNPIFGNLNDENVKQLLTIFAYLLAQGRNPLQFFQDSKPNPGQVLLDLGREGAPTLEQYLDQIKLQGQDEKEYVKKEFTPTMVKIRDIVYGTDLEGQLAILETDYGMPDQSKKTIEDRIAGLLKAKKSMEDSLKDSTEKANQELKDTQDLALTVIKDLQTQIQLKGSVSGILKFMVLEDTELRKNGKLLGNLYSSYSKIENEILPEYYLDNTDYFNVAFIWNFPAIFEEITKDNYVFSKKIFDFLKVDEKMDNKMNLEYYEQFKIRNLKDNVTSTIFKISNAFLDKAIFDTKNVDIYNTNFKKLLTDVNEFKKMKDDDILKIDYSKVWTESKIKINELADKCYDNFISIKQLYENNRKELMNNYNTIYDTTAPTTPSAFNAILELKNMIALLYTKNTKYSKFKQKFNLIDNEKPLPPLPPLPPYKKGKPPIPEFASVTLFSKKPIPVLVDEQNLLFRIFKSDEDSRDDYPEKTYVTESFYDFISKILNEEFINKLIIKDSVKDKIDDSKAEKLLLIYKEFETLIFLTVKHVLLQLNFYYARFFYRKIRFSQQKINDDKALDLFNPDDIDRKKSLVVANYCLLARANSEATVLENLDKSCARAKNILTKSVITQSQAGGAHNLPITSPKLVKRMIRQMKNNVLSGEVIDEEENLESLMEIYGEQTVDSTLGICSLSMLFLLLETNLMKNNMNELREAIYMPLQGLQKDKAYEFLQDFFSSFQDLDHSSQLSLQLKKETINIPKAATQQAKEILTSMFSIDAAPTQYANEFIVFLQLVRTVLEENSHILEELGCLIPT